MEDVTAPFSIQAQEFSGWCGSNLDASEDRQLFSDLY